MQSCAKCEFKDYIVVENWNLTTPNGAKIIINFSLDSTYSSTGIPYILEFANSGNPYTPGLSFYIYKGDYHSISITSVNIITDKGDKFVLLDNTDIPIIKKLKFNRFYDRIEAYHDFIPFDIDYSKIKDLKVMMTLFIEKGQERFNIEYEMDFNKDYTKGIDFFHAWSGD